MKNKVVIIGAEHHNTLAVVRCFGIKKVETKILIHGEFSRIKDIKISHSKFAKNIDKVSDSEQAIVDWLITNKEQEKMVIIPCSDLAEYTIDRNFDKLKKWYIIPGFKNNPGKVCKLMDKYEQKKWAEKNNIPMAKTWRVEKNNKNKFDIPKDLSYPCIVKPEVSAFGSKSDISIAKNLEELKKILKIKYENYEEVLIQQFINKKYELVAQGCMVNNEVKIYGGVTRKIIEPEGGGSIFCYFINDEEELKFANNLLEKLYIEGYRGLYDIELLVCEDKIYLNEINFRHSGQGYGLIQNGIPSPYISFLDSINAYFDKNIKLKDDNAYFINELAAVTLLNHKKMSFKNFILCIKKSSSFAFFCKKDLRGTFAYYSNVIISKIKYNFKRKRK